MKLFFLLILHTFIVVVKLKDPEKEESHNEASSKEVTENWCPTTCEEEGKVYESPNLSSYCICEKEGKSFKVVHHNCSRNEIFNTTTQGCQELVGNGYPICVVKNKQCPNNETGIKKHPKKEFYKNYVVCMNDSVIVAQCDPTSHYSDNQKRCIKDDHKETILSYSECQSAPKVDCQEPGVTTTQEVSEGHNNSLHIPPECEKCYYICSERDMFSFDLTIQCHGNDATSTEEMISTQSTIAILDNVTTTLPITTKDFTYNFIYMSSEATVTELPYADYHSVITSLSQYLTTISTEYVIEGQTTETSQILTEEAVSTEVPKAVTTTTQGISDAEETTYTEATLPVTEFIKQKSTGTELIQTNNTQSSTAETNTDVTVQNHKTSKALLTTEKFLVTGKPTTELEKQTEEGPQESKTTVMKVTYGEQKTDVETTKITPEEEIKVSTAALEQEGKSSSLTVLATTESAAEETEMTTRKTSADETNKPNTSSPKIEQTPLTSAEIRSTTSQAEQSIKAETSSTFWPFEAEKNETTRETAPNFIFVTEAPLPRLNGSDIIIQLNTSVLETTKTMANTPITSERVAEKVETTTETGITVTGTHIFAVEQTNSFTTESAMTITRDTFDESSTTPDKMQEQKSSITRTSMPRQTTPKLFSVTHSYDKSKMTSGETPAETKQTEQTNFSIESARTQKDAPTTQETRDIDEASTKSDYITEQKHSSALRDSVSPHVTTSENQQTTSRIESTTGPRSLKTTHEDVTTPQSNTVEAENTKIATQSNTPKIEATTSEGSTLSTEEKGDISDVATSSTAEETNIIEKETPSSTKIVSMSDQTITRFTSHTEAINEEVTTSSILPSTPSAFTPKTEETKRTTVETQTRSTVTSKTNVSITEKSSTELNQVTEQIHSSTIGTFPSKTDSITDLHSQNPTKEEDITTHSNTPEIEATKPAESTPLTEEKGETSATVLATGSTTGQTVTIEKETPSVTQNVSMTEHAITRFTSASEATNEVTTNAILASPSTSEFPPKTKEVEETSVEIQTRTSVVTPKTNGPSIEESSTAPDQITEQNLSSTIGTSRSVTNQQSPKPTNEEVTTQSSKPEIEATKSGISTSMTEEKGGISATGSTTENTVMVENETSPASNQISMTEQTTARFTSTIKPTNDEGITTQSNTPAKEYTQSLESTPTVEKQTGGGVVTVETHTPTTEKTKVVYTTESTRISVPSTNQTTEMESSSTKSDQITGEEFSSPIIWVSENQQSTPKLESTTGPSSPKPTNEGVITTQSNTPETEITKSDESTPSTEGKGETSITDLKTDSTAEQTKITRKERTSTTKHVTMTEQTIPKFTSATDATNKEGTTNSILPSASLSAFSPKTEETEGTMVEIQTRSTVTAEINKSVTEESSTKSNQITEQTPSSTIGTSLPKTDSIIDLHSQSPTNYEEVVTTQSNTPENEATSSKGGTPLTEENGKTSVTVLATGSTTGHTVTIREETPYVTKNVSMTEHAITGFTSSSEATNEEVTTNTILRSPLTSAFPPQEVEGTSVETQTRISTVTPETNRPVIEESSTASDQVTAQKLSSTIRTSSSKTDSVTDLRSPKATDEVITTQPNTPEIKATESAESTSLTEENGNTSATIPATTGSTVIVEEEMSPTTNQVSMIEQTTARFTSVIMPTNDEGITTQSNTEEEYTKSKESTPTVEKQTSGGIVTVETYTPTTEKTKVVFTTGLTKTETRISVPSTNQTTEMEETSTESDQVTGEEFSSPIIRFSENQQSTPKLESTTGPRSPKPTNEGVITTQSNTPETEITKSEESTPSTEGKGDISITDLKTDSTAEQITRKERPSTTNHVSMTEQTIPKFTSATYTTNKEGTRSSILPSASSSAFSPQAEETEGTMVNIQTRSTVTAEINKSVTEESPTKSNQITEQTLSSTIGTSPPKTDLHSHPTNYEEVITTQSNTPENEATSSKEGTPLTEENGKTYVTVLATGSTTGHTVTIREETPYVTKNVSTTEHAITGFTSSSEATNEEVTTNAIVKSPLTSVFPPKEVTPETNGPVIEESATASDQVTEQKLPSTIGTSKTSSKADSVTDLRSPKPTTQPNTPEIRTTESPESTLLTKEKGNTSATIPATTGSTVIVEEEISTTNQVSMTQQTNAGFTSVIKPTNDEGITTQSNTAEEYTKSKESTPTVEKQTSGGIVTVETYTPTTEKTKVVFTTGLTKTETRISVPSTNQTTEMEETSTESDQVTGEEFSSPIIRVSENQQSTAKLESTTGPRPPKPTNEGVITTQSNTPETEITKSEESTPSTEGKGDISVTDQKTDSAEQTKVTGTKHASITEQTIPRFSSATEATNKEGTTNSILPSAPSSAFTPKTEEAEGPSVEIQTSTVTSKINVSSTEESTTKSKQITEEKLSSTIGISQSKTDLVPDSQNTTNDEVATTQSSTPEIEATKSDESTLLTEEKEETSAMVLTSRLTTEKTKINEEETPATITKGSITEQTTERPTYALGSTNDEIITTQSNTTVEEYTKSTHTSTTEKTKAFTTESIMTKTRIGIPSTDKTTEMGTKYTESDRTGQQFSTTIIRTSEQHQTTSNDKSTTGSRSLTPTNEDVITAQSNTPEIESTKSDEGTPSTDISVTTPKGNSTTDSHSQKPTDIAEEIKTDSIAPERMITQSDGTPASEKSGEIATTVPTPGSTQEKTKITSDETTRAETKIGSDSDTQYISDLRTTEMTENTTVTNHAKSSFTPPQEKVETTVEMYARSTNTNATNPSATESVMTTAKKHIPSTEETRKEEVTSIKSDKITDYKTSEKPFCSSKASQGQPCDRVGFFRYNTSCTLYYRCYYTPTCKGLFASNIYECPKCLKFNAKKMRCDFAENVPECTYHTQRHPRRIHKKNRQTESKTCTGPGKFVVPENRSTYYDCVYKDGEYWLTIRKCPRNGVFNEAEKHCEEKKRCHHCSNFQDVSSGCENNRYAYDKYDCQKFYHCHHGVPTVPLFCPDGYAFNEEFCQLKNSTVLCGWNELMTHLYKQRN